MWVSGKIPSTHIAPAALVASLSCTHSQFEAKCTPVLVLIQQLLLLYTCMHAVRWLRSWTGTQLHHRCGSLGYVTSPRSGSASPLCLAVSVQAAAWRGSDCLVASIVEVLGRRGYSKPQLLEHAGPQYLPFASLLPPPN